MMNLDQVKERLALLEAGGVTSNDLPVAGITGVKRAYAQGPESLPETDLPIMVNFTGPTRSFINIGGTLYRESREFRVRLYVTPIQSGIGGEAERLVEPYIQAGIDLFTKRPSLGDGDPDDFISGVFALSYLGDSGVTTLPYAGTNFLGVEFRVAVDAITESEPSQFD